MTERYRGGPAPKLLNPAQKRMLKRMETFKQGRYARDIDRAVASEQERTAMYLEARELGLTYLEIATVWGVTEAAVMQKVRRHEASAANGHS